MNNEYLPIIPKHNFDQLNNTIKNLLNFKWLLVYIKNMKLTTRVIFPDKTECPKINQPYEYILFLQFYKKKKTLSNQYTSYYQCVSLYFTL